MKRFQFSNVESMSFHAPHMLTDAELREMEQGDAAAEGSSSGVEQVPKEGRKPVVIWEVYEYDVQTGRYERPYALFTEEEAARECKRELGWMGVQKLTVWPGLGEWNEAGKPNYAHL